MLQSQVDRSAREVLTDDIITLKALKDFSWKQLAEGTGLAREFVAAALLGQHPLPQSAAKVVGDRLGLSDEQVILLQAVPLRGSIPGGVPSDPTIYRFYEMIQVYGTTLKSIIHEDFGDGIVSAINFRLKVDKIEDADGGHRAIITLDGKFLPTKPY